MPALAAHAAPGVHQAELMALMRQGMSYGLGAGSSAAGEHGCVGSQPSYEGLSEGHSALSQQDVCVVDSCLGF